ncbi:Bifunctional aspartokinase/homoserine dehydrogenase 1 [Enhygromyxa salina]|uniref:Aspartokinase n=1 Tax=Enhygromyxa salina TaxID=215803 RepID=A0A2S9YDB1_9BACT|nr:aspartate kinase [Enhygromyxa salina]PRQ03006.1 Bifunctional aspartokinase/homoserine dehydrogenase 1 [Enhygromyxa salina]
MLKFGGTSVASPQRWRHIASVVMDNVRRGKHPVVVCSALAGVTDTLTALVDAVELGGAPDELLARVGELHQRLADALELELDAVLGDELSSLTQLSARVGPPCPEAWRARVLAFGELLSTKLGAAWLRAQGLNVHWVDARSLLEATPEPAGGAAQRYLSACCTHEPDPAARGRLASDTIDATITQGFIARNHRGETVVLGRGGSDTSAAYLAAKLQAERLEIWTDVPGLFTADPRFAAQARLLPRISYEEAAVFGALGAKVLHPRCLAPAHAAGILLGIRWTDRPEVPGTLIGAGPEFTRSGIKMISSRSSLCLIRMRRPRDWQPVGFMAEVSACFRNRGLSMDLISSSPAEIRATIDLAALPGASARVNELLEELEQFCVPSIIRDVACVSIAGTSVSTELPRLATALLLLGEPSVHLFSHAADDTHVSYVVDAAAARDLVRVMHAAVFDEVDGVKPPGPAWIELQGQNDHARLSTPSPRAARR